MNQTAEPLIAHDTLMSAGAFKPTGHVFIGLPQGTSADALAETLRTAGWGDDELSLFSPRETAADLEAMIDNAGAAAEFGSELPLMRRYVELSREGARWLLVKVRNADHAEQAAAHARRHGAMLAVHYRPLIVEELI